MVCSCGLLHCRALPNFVRILNVRFFCIRPSILEEVQIAGDIAVMQMVGFGQMEVEIRGEVGSASGPRVNSGSSGTFELGLSPFHREKLVASLLATLVILSPISHVFSASYHLHIYYRIL